MADVTDILGRLKEHPAIAVLPIVEEAVTELEAEIVRLRAENETLRSEHAGRISTMKRVTLLDAAKMAEGRAAACKEINQFDSSEQLFAHAFDLRRAAEEVKDGR